MRSDTVTKGMQQGTPSFAVQCAGDDTGRDGSAVDRNRKFL